MEVSFDKQRNQCYFVGTKFPKYWSNQRNLRNSIPAKINAIKVINLTN